jgi:phosphotransacetylase
MSSVPKSHRKEHDFVAVHNLHKIRKCITELAIYDFGYDKDRFEKMVNKYAERIKEDSGKKQEIVERMRKKNESFYADFVEEETKITRDILRNVVSEFELGNSIFPSGDAKLMEYCERRKHIDLAIGWMFVLKQELQYIAETLPGNKNRYENIINEIAKEISLMKGVRRSSNKFLKKKK